MKGFKLYQVCPLNMMKLENNTFWETDKYVEVKQDTPTQTKGQTKSQRESRKYFWHLKDQ